MLKFVIAPAARQACRAVDVPTFTRRRSQPGLEHGNRCAQMISQTCPRSRVFHLTKTLQPSASCGTRNIKILDVVMASRMPVIVGVSILEIDALRKVTDFYGQGLAGASIAGGLALV